MTRGVQLRPSHGRPHPITQVAAPSAHPSQTMPASPWPPSCHRRGPPVLCPSAMPTCTLSAVNKGPCSESLKTAPLHGAQGPARGQANHRAWVQPRICIWAKLPGGSGDGRPHSTAETTACYTTHTRAHVSGARAAEVKACPQCPREDRKGEGGGPRGPRHSQAHSTGKRPARTVQKAASRRKAALSQGLELQEPVSMHCIPLLATGKLDQREQGAAALPSWPRSPGHLVNAQLCAAHGPHSALGRLVSSAAGASDLLHKRQVTEVSLLTSLPGAGAELSGELISRRSGGSVKRVGLLGRPL